jgi:tryptophan synthase beta chain
MSFTRAEGILPAPEAAHAICSALQEAMASRESGEARTIVFNLSGHGHFDLAAYDAYLHGDLKDYEYPAKAIEQALAALPQFG